MVLAELGGKLRDSLRKLHSAASGHVTEQHLNSLLADITRALIESDVNVKLVLKLRDNIKQKVQAWIEQEEEDGTVDQQQQQQQQHQQRPSQVSKTVQKVVVEELVSLLQTNRKPYVVKRGKANVILFVGLQGAGKTTTIAKYANYYQRRGFKVAMVCADTFRAGAFDQLKQNATKLRVPFGMTIQFGNNHATNIDSFTECLSLIVDSLSLRRIHDEYGIVWTYRRCNFLHFF